LDVDEVRRLCAFNYSCSLDFPTHNGTWDDPDNGLFGYDDGHELLQSAINALDNQMYNEFFNDYGTLKDKTGIVVGNRNYSWILDRERILSNPHLDSEWKSGSGNDT
jgi:hypothetical protein